MTNKHSWLIFGAVGETGADVPLGRWLPFANDEAAKASPAYEGYAWAGIADAQGGQPRLTWTAKDEWTEVGKPASNARKPEAVKVTE